MQITEEAYRKMMGLDVPLSVEGPNFRNAWRRKMPGRVMIDIETLSTRNNALVLSVAAVNFDVEIIAGTEAPKPPLIGSKSLWVLDVREQLMLGRHVDPKTQAWWREQAARAREHLDAVDYITVADFATEFQGVVGAQDEVWAHGVTFDVCILESLLADIKWAPPWKHYGVIRDVRTVVRTFPKLREAPPREVIEHDPVDDCVSQIWDLWEYWPNATA